MRIGNNGEIYDTDTFVLDGGKIIEIYNYYNADFTTKYPSSISIPNFTIGKDGVVNVLIGSYIVGNINVEGVLSVDPQTSALLRIIG